jgi:hypothetical protein
MVEQMLMVSLGIIVFQFMLLLPVEFKLLE